MTTPFAIAVLEITLMLLGAFILGVICCSLLKKLGICCRKSNTEEASLFAPVPTDNTATPVTNTVEPAPEVSAPPAPVEPVVEVEEKPEPSPEPVAPTPVAPAPMEVAIPEPAPAMPTPSIDPNSSGYVADINSLLRRNNTSDGLGDVSIAELLKRDVDVVARNDNLTKIKGLNARAEKLLRQSGITSYEQLAKTDQLDLRDILEDGGMDFFENNPKTWPFQAELAAKEQWDHLKEYQKEID